MLVPVNDAVGRCIYYTGDYDRKITWLCRKLLRPGDTALDIGANLGVVSLAMAKFVGPKGSVHAFEPNPNLHGFLEASADKCGYANLTLHKVALGSEPSQLDLHIPPSNFGAGSFVNRTSGGSISCPIVPLSEIIDREDMGAIRLIKLDVEGFESEVLKGIPFDRVKPHAIIMETNQVTDLAFRDRPEIVTLLDNNYRLFAIPKAVLSMRVEEININAADVASHDILALS